MQKCWDASMNSVFYHTKDLFWFYVLIPIKLIIGMIRKIWNNERFNIFRIIYSIKMKLPEYSFMTPWIMLQLLNWSGRNYGTILNYGRSNMAENSANVPLSSGQSPIERKHAVMPARNSGVVNLPCINLHRSVMHSSRVGFGGFQAGLTRLSWGSSCFSS